MTTATQHQDQEVRLPNVNPSRLNGRVDALTAAVCTAGSGTRPGPTRP
ncbi:hypothetical protein BTHI11S_05980 [Bosea thiooxidans]